MSMSTVETISSNIKKLRELKDLSQKEVSAASGVPQGQYSRIENAKVEPSISTLEKLAAVFEVSLSEFFNNSPLDEDINLSILEKVKMIDTLQDDEQSALIKMIDLAIANKKMKDSLKAMIA